METTSTLSDEVLTILRITNLEEKLKNILEENEIDTLDVLEEILNVPDAWKEINLKIGIVIKLRKGIENFKNTKNLNQQDEDENYKLEIGLMVRPPQSGKTNIMFKMVDKFFTTNSNTGRIPIVIIIGDNNIQLNTQTTQRSEFFPNIKAEKIDSKSKNHKKCGDNLSLIRDIEDKKCNTIFICGHYVRLALGGDISQLINDLTERSNYQYIIQIYIDEADKILNKKIENTINTQWFSSIVEKITLITATPLQLTKAARNFKKYVGQHLANEMYMEYLPGENIHENYHYISKSNFIIIDDNFKLPVEYIKNYMKSSPPNTGDVWFCPGTKQTKSHEAIIDLAKSINPNTQEPYFNLILVVNSNDKSIKYYDNDLKDWLEISIKDNEPIQHQIRNVYISKGGKSKIRLIITGNNCVGRGLTISSEDCDMNVGVISDKCNQNIEEQQQLVSRMNGYTHKGIVPKIVCSENTHRDLLVYEKMIIKTMTIMSNPNKNDRKCDILFFERIVNEAKNETLFYCKPNERVPIMFNLENNMSFLPSLQSCITKEEKVIKIKGYIKDKNNKLYEFINSSNCKQITTPVSDKSYKKHIIDVYNNYKKHKRFSVDFNNKDKQKNSWQCFIDTKKNRFFIILWVVDSDKYSDTKFIIEEDE